MRLAAACLLLAGCGLGVVDGTGGGADNLPTLGAGPYGRLELDLETPADEPFLVTSRRDVYQDPAALPRADGGLRIWFTARSDDDPVDTARIAYAEVPDEHALPDVAPHDVLAAAAAWEADHVGAPSIVRDGDRLVLYYAGGVGAPAIGRAVSDDDGATWTRDPAPVLTGASDPAAVLVEGTWHLFVTRPDAPGIWRATGDGATFTRDAAPTVTARPGLAEAFDSRAVGAPFALVQRSDAGRQHWGLWFAGLGDGSDTAVGFAGSFDGKRWERFAGADPVLAAPAGGPCVLLDGPRGLMLFHEEQRLHLGIGVAAHP